MRAPSRSLPAIAVTGLLTLSLTACSSSVASEDLETKVEELAGGEGLEVDKVDCPEALPAEVDASVVCTVTETNGTERKLDVTTTSVDGNNVNFDVREQE